MYLNANEIAAGHSDIQDALMSSSYIFFGRLMRNRLDFIYLCIKLRLRKKLDENNDTISRKILSEKAPALI